MTISKICWNHQLHLQPDNPHIGIPVRTQQNAKLPFTSRIPRSSSHSLALSQHTTISTTSFKVPLGKHPASAHRLDFNVTPRIKRFSYPRARARASYLTVRGVSHVYAIGSDRAHCPHRHHHHHRRRRLRRRLS